MNEAPAVGGSYALILRVAEETGLAVGRLGRVTFSAGIYVYLGSAMGPGGLRARLRHHLRRAAQPRWHIDWLRLHAESVGYWWVSGPQPLECAWTQCLARDLAAHIPKTGFGSSDCTRGCPAHLLFFGKMKALNDWRSRVEEILAGLSGPVFYCGADSRGGSVYEGAGTAEYRPG